MDGKTHLKEEVVGDALKQPKFILGAIGIGFLAIAMAFLPLVAIIIGLLSLVIAYYWLKGATGKVLGYFFGVMAIASGIASAMFGASTTAGTTSAELKARGGIWKLFGYALTPVDYAQELLWNKPITSSWSTFQNWSSSPSSPTIGSGGMSF